MTTGSAWGFEWGEPWGSEEIVPSDRLLAFVRSPRFAALVDTLGDRTIDLVDVASQITAAFDLRTAEGVHLDRLGAILQLSRYGYGDDRYRVLLQIQAQLILSSTTTTPVILRIVDLFTTHAPTLYRDEYPMGYRVGALLDDLADAPLLVQIIERATAAAYQPSIQVEDADALILDYAGAAVADAGALDYAGAAVAAAGTLAYLFKP